MTAYIYNKVIVWVVFGVDRVNDETSCVQWRVGGQRRSRVRFVFVFQWAFQNAYERHAIVPRSRLDVLSCYCFQCWLLPVCVCFFLLVLIVIIQLLSRVYTFESNEHKTSLNDRRRVFAFFSVLYHNHQRLWVSIMEKISKHKVNLQ